MKNNTIDMKSVLMTMGNIVSLCDSQRRGGCTEEEVMKTFDENVKGLKEALWGDDTIQWGAMTAEDWATLGCVCYDPKKGFYVLPPYLVKILPEDFELVVRNADNDEMTIKVKDIPDDHIWNNIDDLGFTRYGVYATLEDNIDTITGITFGKAFDILRNPVNINRIMRLPKWQPDVYIKVQWPDENSKMTHPYLYVTSRFGSVPWKETVPEMFSADWEVYDERVYIDKVCEDLKKQREMHEAMLNNLDQDKINEITKDIKITKE